MIKYHSIFIITFERLSEGDDKMPKTVVRENESLDEALRRFKRQVNKAGTLQEAKKREYYLKPGLKRKLKSEQARRKNRK